MNVVFWTDTHKDCITASLCDMNKDKYNNFFSTVVVSIIYLMIYIRIGLI